VVNEHDLKAAAALRLERSTELLQLAIPTKSRATPRFSSVCMLYSRLPATSAPHAAPAVGRHITSSCLAKKSRSNQKHEPGCFGNEHHLNAAYILCPDCRNRISLASGMISTHLHCLVPRLRNVQFLCLSATLVTHLQNTSHSTSHCWSSGFAMCPPPGLSAV
jgi:hypothetical protein